MAEVTTHRKSTGTRICNHPQAKARRASALARKKISDTQTPIQRIQTLDNILGKGVGAKRERARNLSKIAPKVQEQVMDTNLTLNPQLAKIHLDATGETTVVKPTVPTVKQDSPKASPFKKQADEAFLSPPVGMTGVSKKRERNMARKAKRANQDR